MNEEIATGAFESEIDVRTIKMDETLVSPLLKGGVDYLPTDIEHQHKVGICTAISRTQLRQKQTGKKYSADFQYLCQKKFYDNNWQEGSSIMNAMKVAKNIGFLPAELFTCISEIDRYLPYTMYIDKLQAVSDVEVERLKTLCVDKIAGYASVNVFDAQSIAKAVDDSKAGILCRYNVGEAWWTPSWQPKDINPLRPPTNPTSGHAIIMSKFDYTIPLQQKLANTWGIDWDLQGCADINWYNYKPTEGWADLLEIPVIPPPFKHNFVVNLIYGQTSAEILALQTALQIDGEFPKTVVPTSFYGNVTAKAILDFRKKYNIPSTSDPSGHSCGMLTRTQLNILYNII